MHEKDLMDLASWKIVEEQSRDMMRQSWLGLENAKMMNERAKLIIKQLEKESEKTKTGN